MFEIQFGKKQQDDRVCVGHFWICSALLVVCASALQSSVYIAGCVYLCKQVLFASTLLVACASSALLHTVVVYGSLHCYIR